MSIAILTLAVIFVAVSEHRCCGSLIYINCNCTVFIQILFLHNHVTNQVPSIWIGLFMTLKPLLSTCQAYLFIIF